MRPAPLRYSDEVNFVPISTVSVLVIWLFCWYLNRNEPLPAGWWVLPAASIVVAMIVDFLDREWRW